MLDYNKYIENLKISLDDVERNKDVINQISKNLIECFNQGNKLLNHLCYKLDCYGFSYYSAHQPNWNVLTQKILMRIEWNKLLKILNITF